MYEYGIPVVNASSSITENHSVKSNEEWPYIALPCYNESEKEHFYMKWLIVNRLKRPSWCFCEMSEVGSNVQSFYKNKPEAARNKGFRTYESEKDYP